MNRGGVCTMLRLADPGDQTLISSFMKAGPPSIPSPVQMNVA